MNRYCRKSLAWLLGSVALVALLGGPRVSAAFADYSRRIAEEKARKKAASEPDSKKPADDRPDESGSTRTASIEAPKAGKSDGSSSTKVAGTALHRICPPELTGGRRVVFERTSASPQTSLHRGAYQAQAPPSIP